jgi:hypothetical protein
MLLRRPKRAFCNSESLIKKVHAFFSEIFGTKKPPEKGILKAVLEAWSPWFAVLVKNNASGSHQIPLLQPFSRKIAFFEPRI